MKIRSFFIYSLFIGTHISCGNANHKTKEQEIAIKYIEDSKEILALSKQGADLIGKAMKVAFSDSMQAAKYYRDALDKFLAAVAIDTTRKRTGIYLPDLYGKLKMRDSVIYWRNWLGVVDQ